MNINIRTFLLTISLAIASQFQTAADDIVVSTSISADTTWTANNTYILDGRIFVEEPATLTIEAGTVVKGRAGQQESASVLVIAPGAKIMAEGTVDNPIVFTAEEDDLSDPFDLGPTDKGRWGGLILLGRATLNSPADSGTPITDNIEGIPATDARGIFGGSNDADSSGVLRYVSIRHGGTKIADNNEINGLTLGGVGSGTTVEFVEVFANLDDGFEFFGGTVGAKYLVAAYCGDDSYDYDQGFRGKGQFWFAIADDGDRGGEHDGDVDNFDSTPLSRPTIFNATYIGNGVGVGSQDALTLRENAGGFYMNSIFTEYGDRALDIPDDAAQNMAARIAAGDLDLRNNIFFGFGSADANASTQTAQVFFTDAARNNSMGVDPQLSHINRVGSLEEAEQTDPRPMAGSLALQAGVEEPNDPWFSDVSFIGAFGNVNWAAGWSVISQSALLSNAGAGVPNYPSVGSGGEVGPELSVTMDAGQIMIRFSSEAGVSYDLQSASSVGGSWQSVQQVNGDGSVITIPVSVNASGNEFFRLQVQ